MSIAKPFTFVANTYAKASEVNADFDVVYSQVNTNISAIAQNANDIDNLENTKANINGSTSNVFKVADAIADGDAINKRVLMKSIGNTVDYIGGLTITKDSGSPEDTIIVSAGSAYDSTHTIVLSLGNSLSKQNLNQAANTTYYVYIIGNSTGSLIDISIDDSSVEPPLPTGYSLYRQIGYYTTNSDNEIDSIGYYGLGFNSDKSTGGILNTVAPDWDNKVSKTADTEYIAESNGWIVARGYAAGGNHTMDVYINGVIQTIIVYHGGGGSSYTIPIICPVAKGDTYKVNWANEGIYFVPVKGA